VISSSINPLYSPVGGHPKISINLGVYLRYQFDGMTSSLPFYYHLPDNLMLIELYWAGQNFQQCGLRACWTILVVTITSFC